MNIRKTNTAGSMLGLLLWALSSGMQAQVAEGVGIHTENIKGVFHIDAAGNNPTSGSIPPAQQADDVVITAEGYAGIGTTAPTTQLHIHTQNQTGVIPLRLADGAGAGELLTSDEEGNVSWETPPTPPSSAVYLPMRYAPVNEVYPVGDTTVVSTSRFTVPDNGLYSADLRLWLEWWAGANSASTNTTFYQTITRLQLVRKTGNVYKIVDEYQYNELSYTRITTFVTLYASASAGDELSIWVNPVVMPADLVSDPRDFDQTKFRIFYKKLGVDDNTNYFD